MINVTLNLTLTCSQHHPNSHCTRTTMVTVVERFMLMTTIVVQTNREHRCRGLCSRYQESVNIGHGYVLKNKQQFLHIDDLVRRNN